MLPAPRPPRTLSGLGIQIPLSDCRVSHTATCKYIYSDGVGELDDCQQWVEHMTWVDDLLSLLSVSEYPEWTMRTLSRV